MRPSDVPRCRIRRTLPVPAIVCCLAAFGGICGAGAQLLVYDTAHFQSPVRGLPGDLLMVTGSGFQQGARAFYQYASDPTLPPAPPAPLPATNNAWSGELDLYDDPSSSFDAYVNVPESLTVKLPMAMQADWPYAIHVLNADGEWSDPVFINDPRPLWLSPDFAYRKAKIGSSPRRLAVVGRNLVPLFEDPMVVRLTGPEVYVLVAASAVATGVLDHYVIEVDLPVEIEPGIYHAEVMREGVWFPVVYGELEVLEDPLPPPIFYPASYGGCQPSDGADDTACIQAAIDAASGALGGTVFLAAGQWDLMDSAAAGQPSPTDTGILLRSEVTLAGVSAAATELVKHPGWLGHTTITVESHNEIRDLHFVEVSGPRGPPSSSYLRLGKYYPTVPEIERPTMMVKEVVIHDCLFTGTYYAIGEGGFPLRRVHITDNTFHAFRDGLYLAGDPNLEEATFNIKDSVIERNLFWPGAFALPPLGPIASELGAAERLTFRDNVADGTVEDGWRAAFFWHQESNNEMLLIVENLATCTGDQGHDGEAIAFDGNRNIVGFVGSQVVLASSSSGVEVAASWIEPTPGFYLGSWVVVVEGPGLGQARKIVDYTQAPTASIQVEPPWDVVPKPGQSQIVVSRAYWSTYVVDNDVDNRKASGCKADNPSAQQGLIGNLGWTFDSTIEGNRQYDSGGIHISKQYSRLNADGLSVSMGIYASEIRGNLLDGEPTNGTTGKGGIEFWHSAKSGEPSIVLSHNLVIAHNTIRAADGTDGAIGTRVSAGATSDPWSLSTIHIFRNTIQDVPVGIVLSGNSFYPQTWRSVLQGNTFFNVPTPWVDNAQETAILP
jgi:hypothetical protein